jgi:hypothetical protein
MYTMNSIVPPTPSVKESLAAGLNVCLPSVLDDFQYYAEFLPHCNYAVIAHLSYEVAAKYDISATQAEDVIYYTLRQLGVNL